jgi:MFS family permease
VLGPIVAQAADYWGRKGLLVMLTSMGAVGSIIVSCATSMNMAIAGFCVIGIAFGAQPLLHTVTSEILPRRYRGWAQAADMTANSLGAIAGLLVGAALNRTNDPASQGFRNYFLFNMASYAASVLLCLVVYNPPQLATQKGLTHMEKLAKLDWAGYLLLLTGPLLFSVGMSFSNNPYKWSDPRVFATFIVGLAVCGCLVVYAWRFKKDGMFHHALFTRNRNFSLANICVFAEGVAFIAANNYFAFQASLMYETDALMVGLRYSVMLLVAMCSAAATGWYCAVFRKVRWITVVAFLIFTAFFVGMATTTPGSGKPVWFYGILLGTALGMTLTTLVVVAQLSTPPELISVTSGLIISTRSLGGTVGLAICKLH